MDNGQTLAEIARLHKLGYGALSHCVLRMRLDPIRRVGYCKLYSAEQVQTILAEMGVKVKTAPIRTPEPIDPALSGAIASAMNILM